jgi:Flp pilus assembly protein TadG
VNVKYSAGNRGSSLVEFSLVAVMLTILMLGVFEMGRMVLVYTTVANAGRAGTRYAITHGSTRCDTPSSCGSGVDGPSGPADNPTQVVTLIKNIGSAGLLDINRLVITVHYPDPFPSNAVGQRVNVTVVYPYDPFTTFFPLRVRLGSTSQGIITF